tara:strand:+ start:366 stop:1088 length:723 start_codon:yes stop_codon:yes gene_type:complete
MLRPSILKAMECYVYILSDPSDNEIFYVGKGRGNRVFSHLTDQSDNPKTRKIKEIRAKGLEPKIEFLVHGVDDHTAKKIEAAIIDLIGKNKLTNKVRGYESSYFGRMDVDQIRSRYESQRADITENVLLIKLTDSFSYNMSPMDLYDYTRGIWIVAKHRRETVTHVFAVYDGIIQETYNVVSWFRAGTTFTNRVDIPAWQITDRWEFVGSTCEEMREKYRYKSAAHYWPANAQNPVRYTF